MAIIELKIKIACGEDISDTIIDAAEKEGFSDAIARHLSGACESDNLAVEITGVPSKRLV